MEPTGVRCACPDCTFSVVMKSETDCPPPVTKVVEGLPWCPNCDVPMKPVASVKVTDKPPGVGAVDGLDDHQRLGKIRELEREVQQAEAVVRRTKEAAKDAKNVFEARVTTLRTAIERLTATPGEKPPLLALAEDEQLDDAEDDPGDIPEDEDEDQEDDQEEEPEPDEEPVTR